MTTESYQSGPRGRLPDSRFPLSIPSRYPVTGEPIGEWLDAPSSVDGGWNDYRDALDTSS